MDEKEKLIQELLKKIDAVSQRQQLFQQEIAGLQKAVRQLSGAEGIQQVPWKEEIKKEEVKKEAPAPPAILTETGPPATPPAPVRKAKKEKTPLEEFIGTNLLNKIGIAVLVIGVGIGAKYAIDHDLISPLTRIVLGYLAGIVLIGLALRLRARYAGFSAVLLSGGMAVLYFITFAAYDFYHLIPQALAFVLMVAFTGFTVFAAIQYNLQVVAIIGLVGAYAVPVLLSDGSGKVVILFSYMTIINTGILILAFHKAWKALYYLAFGLTWLVFSGWSLDRYDADEHLWISLIFSSIFFVTFYATFLSYKLIQRESLTRADVMLLLLNSFLYYGFGYAAIEGHQQGEAFLGIFTVFNAILHFLACFIIYKRQDATRDTFYFVAGMVLVFLTLAVPVQLEGKWVTIVWGAESAVLFWIGRTKGFPVYERLSYALVALTFFSFLQDLDTFYGHSYAYGPGSEYVRFFLNVQFLSSLMVAAALGWIVKLNLLPKPAAKEHSFWQRLDKVVGWTLPVIFGITLYLAFYKEIENYWQQRYYHSQVYDDGDGYDKFDYDLLKFQRVWLLNYAALFTLALGLINLRWLKNKAVTFVVTGLSTLVLFNFITTGLLALTELRAGYLEQTDARFYFRDSAHILIRYVTILFMAPLLWLNFRNVKESYFPDGFRKAERIIFHTVLLAVLSNELVGALDLMGITDSDKLALSILWGVYGLALIVYGLQKNLKYIRVTAIVLFGITLVKLFLWDMASLTTIGKTVVLVVLGALLLVASFLYNKFKSKADDKN